MNTIVERGSGKDEGQPEGQGEIRFRDIGLTVGDRMMVEPPAKIGDQQGVAKLIGWVPEQTIMVTVPDVRSWAGPLIEGDEINIRTFCGRHAFGFSTQVVKRSMLPFSHLHLAFPDRISTRQVRNAARVSTLITARVLDVSEPTTTVVTNLSATGAEVRAWMPARVVGDTVSLELSVEIHKVPTWLVLNGIIRNRHEIADSGEPAYGVEFFDMGAQTAVFLNSYVYQSLVEQPNRRL